MESAPEEHSSLGSSNPQSSPDLQRMVNEIEAAKKAVEEDSAEKAARADEGDSGEKQPGRSGSDKQEVSEGSRNTEGADNHNGSSWICIPPPSLAILSNKTH